MGGVGISFWVYCLYLLACDIRCFSRLDILRIYQVLHECIRAGEPEASHSQTTNADGLLKLSLF